MEIAFSETALSDLNYWKTSHNEKVIIRINQLLNSIQDNPFEGIGKPEPLKHKLSGYWSRRITKEHRLVYKTEGNNVLVISLRYHY